MVGKKELLDDGAKIIQAIESAKEEMIAFKKYKKTPVVVSIEGKVVKLDPDEYSKLLKLNS